MLWGFIVGASLPAATLRAWPRAASPVMVLSFEDALETAPRFCQTLQDEESPTGLENLLATSAGARGFFVHWLTNEDYTRADRDPAPAPLADALQRAPTEVTDVMVMNVIMSAATTVAHDRAGRAEEAHSSGRTLARAQLLARSLSPSTPLLRTGLAAVVSALSEEDAGTAGDAVEKETEDAWINFLQRWQYDDEQLERVNDAVVDCL